MAAESPPSAGVLPELSCPLCLDLIHDPVCTPCRHLFCRTCVARVLGAGHASCPICRRDIRGFDAQAAPADQTTVELVAASVPGEVIAARAREAASRLEIVVGNLYEEVAARGRNSNKWTMYVTLRGAAGHRPAALIERVVYNLHPTFKPQMVSAFPPTFGICRFGWGTFTVNCEIHWSSRLRMPPTQVDHELVFHGDGGRTPAVVDIDPGLLEGALRAGAVGGAPAMVPASPPPALALDNLDIVIGNRCARRSEGDYRWTMYVQLPHFRGSAHRMIEGVDYELHRTFSPSVVSRRAPPFEITRIGWGTFPVLCTIRWSRALHLQPTQIVHELDFQDGGGETAASVQVRPVYLSRFRA